MKTISIFGQKITQVKFGEKIYKLSTISEMKLKNGKILKNTKDFEHWLYNLYFRLLTSDWYPEKITRKKNAKR